VSNFIEKIKNTTCYMVYLVVVILIAMWLLDAALGARGKSSTSAGKTNPLHLFSEEYYPYVFDPYLTWRHKAGSPIVRKVSQDPDLPVHDAEGNAEVFVSDDLGFIPNKAGQKSSDSLGVERKIFMFGGSTVQGGALSDYSMTLPARLENELQKKGQKVSVINAGVGGYHLAQEKAYAFNELIHRKPAGFIFYDGWNNAWASEAKKNIESITRSPYSEQLTTQINRLMDSKSNYSDLSASVKTIVKYFYPNVSTWISNIKRKSAPTESQDSVAGGEKTEKSATQGADLDKVLDEELKNSLANMKYDLIQSVAMCNIHEIKCMFILQPVMFTGKKPLTKIEKEVYAESQNVLRTKNLVTIYPHYRKLYKELSERFSSQKNIKFLDLTDIFDKEERRVYWDTGHLFDLGHQILAESIAKDAVKLNFDVP
jgi:hypothetical protein